MHKAPKGKGLTKPVEDIYRENDETLKRYYRVNLRKWRDIAIVWVGRVNIMKM